METYSEDQVEQILRYALAKRTSGQNLTKQQVYEIASDMGVSESDFLVAIQEWQSQQGVKREQADFDLYKQKSLRSNLLKYAIVNSFLVALNLLTSGHIGWAIYPLIFWGLGISLDAWVAYQKDSEEYEKQFLKWQRKQKRDQLTNQIAGKIVTSLEDWLKQ
ncbi:MAG: 2TM domain-containing protein [Pseudanabaenaceae cyanobacterium bins.39]|nr:2TM domain-containing protein [Pseudanabaenaceae cyanobacterium bins.39]